MPSDVEQLRNILKESVSPLRNRYSEEEVQRLTKHYEIVLKWNQRLSLTTLTKPRDFFERHILESSLIASLLLPSIHQLWDIGSGLGVPGLPIAILRPDLAVYLIESSRNKALFLEEAADFLSLKNVTVIESRFEALDGIPSGACLTVRAMEGMEEMTPQILGFGAEAAQILILGSKALEGKVREILGDDQGQLECSLIPGSDRRYVINIIRST